MQALKEETGYVDMPGVFHLDAKVKRDGLNNKQISILHGLENFPDGVTARKLFEADRCTCDNIRQMKNNLDSLAAKDPNPFVKRSKTSNRAGVVLHLVVR